MALFETIAIRRLGPSDVTAGRDLFQIMAAVFEEHGGTLSEAYAAALLARDDFWAIEAVVDGEVAGGLTGYTLPLTREETLEVLIYDIAVQPRFQRRGIGRELVATLRRLAAQAGLGAVWVLADNEDAHALDFYRALGASPAAVTAFTFPALPDG